MRRCLRNGNILAFSIGLLISRLLPQGWLVIAIAAILAVTSIAGSRCCRY